MSAPGRRQATPMTRVALHGVSHWHARMHLDAFARAGAEIVALGDAAESSCAGFAPDVDCPRYRSIDALVEGVRAGLRDGHGQARGDGR
jgi:predicted dehydrogenase